MTKPEIIRFLEGYIARDVYNALLRSRASSTRGTAATPSFQ